MPPLTRSKGAVEESEDTIVISSDDEKSGDKRGLRTSPRQLTVQNSNLVRRTPKKKSPRKDLAQSSPCDSPRVIERLANEREKISTRLNEVRKELRRVKKEHAELRVQNRRLQNETCTKVFDKIQDSILCDICQENLWDPYLLISCGHTACRGCLIKWFSTTISKDAQAPHLHCPKCRQSLEKKPVPNYLLKSLVETIAPLVNPDTKPPVGTPNDGGWSPFQKFFH